MSEVVTGAVEGGAKGYAVGGVWGAVAGAAVGGIGGMFGDKAKKYKRKATKEDQIAAEIQQAQQRRQIARSGYLARSEALAAAAAEPGGLQSSAPRGALSSIGTQTIYNLKFFDSLVAREIMKNYYLKKAGKNQEYSNTINGLLDAATSMGGGMGGGGGSSSSGSSSGGSSSSNMFGGSY